MYVHVYSNDFGSIKNTQVDFIVCVHKSINKYGTL